ncbi:hypothetical protein Tco_0918107 [Tanacetum coccineum]
MLQDAKSWLGKCFSMKDLGEAAYILGIKIYRDRSKRLISLGQSVYIDKTLKKFKIENSKRENIIIQEKPHLRKTQGASTPKEVRRMQKVPYALAVGSIMYVAGCTRPYIAFAQNLTSRFQQNPGECYWITIKNILKYIRNTKDMFLVYGGDLESNEKPMEIYCDNSGAIIIANELGIHKGAKHYQRKVHYIREVIELGDVNLLKVHTDYNLADSFTKSMPCTKHVEHVRGIGL